MGLYNILTFKLCYYGTSLVVILSILLPPCSNEMNTVFLHGAPYYIAYSMTSVMHHWVPSAIILLHVSWHCKLSIRCIRTLDFIAQSKGVT